MFYLSGLDGQKLKPHTATSRGGKHVLKIEVEYDRVVDMAFDVERLDAVADAQIAAAKKRRDKGASRRGTGAAKPKQIKETPTLALPAPDADSL